MRINVREIVAQCPKCGGDDFHAIDGKRNPLASQTRMRCAGCDHVVLYVDLVMQIAEKAMAASAATLQEIRRRRGK